VTLKIISRQDLCRLQRHFVCVSRIEWWQVDVLSHFIRKTHTKWRSRWHNAWRKM